MVLLMVSFTITAGGDYLIGWPRGEDLKGYEPGQAYRLSLDFSFLPRHKIGIAFHPTRFDSTPYRYEGETFDIYYGFDLIKPLFNLSPSLNLILGGCYQPWRLKYQNETLELPTGKVEFKDWGYFAGLELGYEPISFLELRLGGAYYFIMSEHMEILGFNDHDEKFIVGFAGLRFRI